MSIKDKGEFPITDARMTRFMISLDDGVKLVWHAFEDMEGGEIYVKKIPSMKITDIAASISQSAVQKLLGSAQGKSYMSR